MPEGCQLDASPRSTGWVDPACKLSPPRPFCVSAPLASTCALHFGTVALAWFSPERLSCVGPPTFSAEPVGLPCNVEHFARATISARNPLCPVLKVRPDAVMGILPHSVVEDKHMFEDDP